MIILHKANRIDNGEEIQGFLTKMWGSYHIILENDENNAYPVSEDTINPCIDTKDNTISDLHSLIREQSLLDSIMKCMLRYSFENDVANTYQCEMRSLICNYEDEIAKKIFELTGKTYSQLCEEKLIN